MLLERFAARGYRNLDTEVTLGRCTVLVGPNNCGKSNLMKAIQFAADGASTAGEKNWAKVIRQHGGKELVNRALAARADWLVGERGVALEWSWRQGGFTGSASLTLSDAGTEFPVVTRDATAFRDWETISTVFESGHVVVSHGPERTEYPGTGPEHPLLGSVMTERVPALEEAREMQAFYRARIARQLYMSLAETAPRELARPADPDDPGLLAPRGAFAAHLRRLESEFPAGLVFVRNALAELIPGLDRLWLSAPAGAGAAWVQLVVNRQPSPLREWSDGTIVALLLATLLHGPENRPLLMLDEPELNLHPAWLKVVARWLAAPTAADQIIFSTHSTDLLDALTEGFRKGEVTVLVADSKAGFKNLDPATLETFFGQGYELGDLYRMGEPAVGGWPW